MTTTRSIVIVGGGIVGLSTAWHLLQRGCRDILICERDAVGAGSTGRASGGIRQQFAREVEIRMAVESVAFWESFDRGFAARMGFRQCGYLYLLTEPERVAEAERNVALQVACGAPSRIVSPDEIGRMVPEVNLDGVLAGSFCPTDGRASPMGAIEGLSRQLRGFGVEIRESCRVTQVHVEHGRVVGLTAGGERITAPVVVNAAGPHAAEVARLAGLALPVRPVRMHQFVTGPITGLTPGRPVLVEPATTLFAAQEGQGMLLGMRQPDASGEHVDVDWAFWPDLLAVAAHRIPALRDAEVDTAWAGLVEMSPDHVGIIGTVPELAGFVCANGLSGHGFMLAPAVGRIAACLALGDAMPEADLAALSPMRLRTLPV
jgi:sarcosine oxidase subunit beta